MITILFANSLALPIKHSTYFTYMHKQAFSQKGVRASLDSFGQNIGRHWTPKILKGKKITSVFNEEALTKASSTFLTFNAQLTV